jgi:hypothetical protein
MTDLDQELRSLLEVELINISSDMTDAVKEISSNTLGTVRFYALCERNASEVLAKSKEIMKIIIENSLKDWPSDEDWAKKLPQWFISECAPEMSQEEANSWIKWWHSLSREQQDEVEKNKKWSLLDWLYWLEPSRRAWFWWDAQTKGNKELLIAVEVTSWPFAWGALGWLFRACGAKHIESES